MRVRRRLGTALLVVGILALAYGAAVYFWKDPVTGVYTSWKQHQLADQLDQEFADYRTENPVPVEPVASTDVTTTGETTGTDQGSFTSDTAAQAEQMAAETRRAAERFLKKLEPGQALGRIDIPKLGIDPVVVNGTSGADLRRGPGRYPETSLPGLGQLTAIAGHRTTFGAPFRNIDSLTKGNQIVLELPYGTFTYQVTDHEIVDDEDWSIIEPRGYDTLVLSACHPLYSADQRWIVYAKLMKVELPDGESYAAPVAVAAATG